MPQAKSGGFIDGFLGVRTSRRETARQDELSATGASGHLRPTTIHHAIQVSLSLGFTNPNLPIWLAVLLIGFGFVAAALGT